MGLLTRDRPRGNEVATDMLRSLAVVLLFVLVAGVWFIFARSRSDPVRTIDYRPELRAARAAAAYHVLAPAGLPASWRPTSARHAVTGRALAFHLGLVTPKGRYADVDESDGPAAAFVQAQLGPRPRPLSTVPVGGGRWQELSGARGELALARLSGDVTVVVHGSAGLDELVRLAAALR
ncbi:MAG: DUF4245 domain-containing protein [Frankiaceae bacterium]